MGIRLVINEQGELRIPPEALQALCLPGQAGTEVFAERRGREVVLSTGAEWEKTETWVRAYFQEQIKGMEYKEDSPFLFGLTRREYLALSEQEKEDLWEREYRKESERLDREEERDVPTYFTTAGQKRRAPSTRRPRP
jgi:hypothetical protein